MASLANQTISSTYDGLVKTSTDQPVPISGVQLLEDGVGNSLALSVGRANQGVTITGTVTATAFSGDLTGDVTGDVTGNVTGNVTGDLTGNVSGNVTGDLTGDVTGTILTAAQTNITSVGTLSSLAVSGNLTVDTDTLFVDSVNNRVGTGGTPAVALEVQRTQTGSSLGEYPSIRVINKETGATSLSSMDTQSSNGSVHVQVAAITLGGQSYGRISTLTNQDLRFLTNSTEKMRILAGGGITFNGDTAAANALDDYEEGSWTATDGSGAGLTFSVVYGTYVKIGKQVTVHFRLKYPSTADASGAVIDGLPFTVSSPGGNYMGGVSTWNDSSQDITFMTINATSTFLLRKNSNNTDPTNSSLSDKTVRGTLTYETV